MLAHPWMKEGTRSRPAATRKEVLPYVHDNAPVDSPLLDSLRNGRRAMASPGVAQLKEAFDVTYAVHRMEEEGNRKGRVPGGAGPRSHLQGLNEEDEEDVEAAIGAKHGDQAKRAIAERAAAQQRAKQKKATADANQQYVGYGGVPNPREAERELYYGQAGNRDRGHRNFELDMGNATLLGRRKGVNKPSRLSEALSPMRIDD